MLTNAKIKMMCASTLMSLPLITTAQVNQTEEELIVTGFRGSLQNAAAIKENASGIVDGISAEDVGKFPDGNVAESLQRVPGVAIARGRGGDGRFVTVRGLGEEFNAVTYNGRVLATENLGREFSFDNIASELVSRVEVFKSPEARHGDGSIGGRVNIVSAKPFDGDGGFNAAFSATGSHDTLSEEDGFKASGVISNTFSESFGVILSVNYMQRDFRVDVAESIDTFQLDVWDTGSGDLRAVNFANEDTDGDGIADTDLTPAGWDLVRGDARYTSMSYSTTTEERERLGGSLAFQFRPSDDLDMTLDLLYTEFESPGQQHAAAFYPCPACVKGTGGLRDVTLADNGVLTGYTWDQNQEYNSRFQDVDTETIQIGFNADWQLSDNLKLMGDVAWSRSEGVRDNIGSGSGSGSFYVIGSPELALNTFTNTGDEVPDLVSLTTGYDASTGTQIPIPTQAGGLAYDNLSDAYAANPDAFLTQEEIAQGDNRRLFGGHFTRDSTNDIEDTVLSLKVDGEWDFDDNNSLMFGMDYVDRNKVNEFGNNRDRWCNYFCAYGYNLRGLNAAAFDAMWVDFPADGFLDDAGANTPNNFLAFTRDGLRALYAAGPTQGDPVLDAEGNPTTGPTGTTHDFSGVANDSTADILVAIPRPDISNDLTEEVFGVYGQLNFSGELAGMTYNANMGIRIARTEVESVGASSEIIGIELVNDRDQNFTFSPVTPVTIKHTYTNVLPSFNFGLNLTDDVILRAAFSDTITRPTLTDLTTSRNVTSTNLDTEAIRAGNPRLSPVKSENIDFSLEWYGENITAAAALFNKEITDFVADAVSEEFEFDRFIEFTRPTNGDEAEVAGLELAWTHLLENGFGYQLNYTYAGSTATGANGTTTELENVSENTYNGSVFFENDLFSVRLSYNYRDEYLRAQEGLQGFPEIVDGYGQLDLTASINVLDNLEVFVEGVNLTEENEFVWSDQRNLIRYYEERGARYALGVRGSF